MSYHYHNICYGHQNQGECQGLIADYSLGKHHLPTGRPNPNGFIPETNKQFKVLYFKYGDEHTDDEGEIDTTYTVKFRIRNRNRKWSCTCPDYVRRRYRARTCCKHIQGCIWILNIPINTDVRLVKILEYHIREY